MLERARLSSTLAQQLEERLVLLREEEKKQRGRSCSFDHDNKPKGQLTWYTGAGRQATQSEGGSDT